MEGGPMVRITIAERRRHQEAGHSNEALWPGAPIREPWGHGRQVTLGLLGGRAVAYLG